MSDQILLRWAGLSAGVGGMLFAAYDIYSFAVASQSDSFSTAAVIGFGILMVAGLLALLGIPGIYAAQSESAGLLGLIGYIVSFVGVALFFAFAWGGVTIAPEIADEASTFISAGPESRLSQLLFTDARQALAALGFLLFAVATIRARVFSRWGPIVLILGSALGTLAALGIANLLPVGEAALGGVGFAILGFELFARKSAVKSLGRSAQQIESA